MYNWGNYIKEYFMKYIKKISEDEYEYFQQESKKIYQAQEKLKRTNKKAMLLTLSSVLVLIVFFRDNNLYFSVFILFSLSYSIWFLEKQLTLILDKQSKLNELLIKSVDALAMDKFINDRTEFIEFNLMDIFCGFLEKHDNIYFDEEGQIKSEDKYVSASSLKKYIKDRLMNKYNDVGDTYDFEDIYKELEAEFIKPRN